MECRLCASSRLVPADENVRDFEYGTRGAYTYWRCLECGLFGIDPLPDAATLGEAYPDDYHAYRAHTNPLARFMKRRYWRRKAAGCAALVGRDAPILDVGCAHGDLLMALRRLGFRHLKGLDFNAEAVEKARRNGLDVDQGEIETAVLAARSLRMIVMTNFIEHVYDPIATLRRAHALLRPGGLVVGETPNVDSWDYRLFRRHWGGYHTPRHLYLFDTRNLGMLADKAGFRVREISNMLQPAHWALSVQNLLQETPFGTRVKGGRTAYFTPLLIGLLPVNVIQNQISKTSSVEFVFERI